MDYIDTGSRDRTQALAAWLRGVLSAEVSEVRVQAAYIGRLPLVLFAPTLRQLAKAGGRVNIVFGSNPPGTPRGPVVRLVKLLGLPRKDAHLGVVQYQNALYHPKTYHFRRQDGSQCAYVGSANLTRAGATRNDEAGITLDTRDGDPADALDKIAVATDVRFAERRVGLHVISSSADVDALVAAGVLLDKPPTSLPKPPGFPHAPKVESLREIPIKIERKVRIFWCNTNRDDEVRDPDGGYKLERLMHQRHFAAAWTPPDYCKVMGAVKKRDLILMYANGTGVIGVGRAAGRVKVLSFGDPDRIRKDWSGDECRISVDWLAWQIENPYPWKTPSSRAFICLSGQASSGKARAALEHFGLEACTQ